jgi:hypothetical protein
MKPTNEKSDVYEITCATRNGHYKYIGQTKRSATACFKEHKSHQLSSVAKLNGGRRLYEHNFDLQNLKVLKVIARKN